MSRAHWFATKFIAKRGLALPAAYLTISASGGNNNNAFPPIADYLELYHFSTYTEDAIAKRAAMAGVPNPLEFPPPGFEGKLKSDAECLEAANIAQMQCDLGKWHINAPSHH